MTYEVAEPASCNPGDLLLLMVSGHGDHYAPPGWTLAKHDAPPSRWWHRFFPARGTYVFTRIATADENLNTIFMEDGSVWFAIGLKSVVAGEPVPVARGPWPCEETTLDLQVGEIDIRLWITSGGGVAIETWIWKDEVTSMCERVSRPLFEGQLRAIADNIAVWGKPRGLAAVQVRYHGLGCMIYTIPFIDGPTDTPRGDTVWETRCEHGLFNCSMCD